MHNWEQELDDKIKLINVCIREIQVLDWEIQNCARFAKKQGENLIQYEKNLHGLLMNLIKDKNGDLEMIRKTQFEFNNAVRLAHAEIMHIDME